MKLLTATLTLIFLTTFGHSQTWVRQNPFVNLSQLNDIDFDGKYGVAVGEDAALFTTNNGGVNWIPRKPVSTATFLTAAFVVPGTMGQIMMAGGDSLVMISRNGGETWNTTHNELPYVYKFQKLPDGTLMALGSDFGIYSVDNGLIWQPFNMPAFGVTAGHFNNTLEGWVAVGSFDNVQVWHTKNRGFNWELLDPLKHPYVNGIEMLSDSVGFLAARDYIYKTINGGRTWVQLNAFPTGGGIQDLFVINEDRIWTSLDNGDIYLSTNGGFQWEEKSPNVINNNRTLGIWANAEGKVWTVGRYLSILYSPDFGLTWTDQYPANKQTLFDPNFYNAFVGMVGGSDGTIMKTRNSGAVWEPVHFPREENFFGIAMTGDSTVVAASGTGKVFRSIDFGKTWNVIGQNMGQIRDLAATNAQTFIVSNELGEIYKTSNTGANWNLVYDGPQALNSIDFFDATFGWAVGAGGMILVTKDGGDSWDLQYNDFQLDFSDVYFPNNLQGWVTSKNLSDSIWHTTNGGIEWHAVGLPLKNFWNAVTFKDANTGWIAGGTSDNGIIYRTDDGGQNWVLDHTSPAPFMGIYSIPNSETVWAVGFGGNIMKYSSCGTPPLLMQLRGELEPCAGDTINYVIDFDDVDVFDWTFPSDWFVIGNSNTSSIHLIAGSATGQVTVQGSDACGDSTAVVFANVAPVTTPDVIISEDFGILTANVDMGSFQWFLNGVEIPGATNPTYKPLANGTYQLFYTTPTSGCETYSNTYTYVIITTTFYDIDKLLAYPNPANDFIIIRYQDGKAIPPGSIITLTTIDGRTIMHTLTDGHQVELRNVPPGLYSLHVQTDKEIMLRKILVE
ncbi:MAG: YCF48-related protein [Bacteroidota bacterium]|nr:YCF48-related protein [Bacteroidota bacterium]